MRSVNTSSLGTIVLGALLTLAAAGCSKKTVAPDSRPVPEGQQNGTMLMLGWHEQASIWFTVHDPGTPNNPQDDALQEAAVDYFQDPAGVRTSTFDFSISNSLEAMRVNGEGNAVPLFDFTIPPAISLIGQGLDEYQFEDLAPPAIPSYFGRGVLNGTVTTNSPVSNPASAFPSCDDNMDFLPLPQSARNDSVLDLQFTDDPRAAFYVVEISDGSGVVGTGDVFSAERRARAIPAPLLPGQRALASAILFMPGGTGQVGLHATISSPVFPLYFHIRVTAFDADGRMVNRLNDYVHTHQVDGGANLETYEPMGGALEVLDPYNDGTHPLNLPPILTRDAALELLGSFLGGGQPSHVTKLGSSPAAAGHGPTSEQFAQVLAAFAKDPRFSQQALLERVQAIRRGMDGAQGGAGSRITTATGVRH